MKKISAKELKEQIKITKELLGPTAQVIDGLHAFTELVRVFMLYIEGKEEKWIKK